LTRQTDDERFRVGLTHLIGIAHGHLHKALIYTQKIPAHEVGIRNFCLWALGMAVLTLKKIRQNLDFKRSDQVKITRNSVKATILATKIAGRSNSLLGLLFNLTSHGLKTPGWTYSTASSKANSDL
jgi:farnesyl-diphosphate farnesyltransferase